MFPIKYGTKSDQVRNLQKFLNAYLGKIKPASLTPFGIPAQIGTDGSWGKQTEAAAKLFFNFSMTARKWPKSKAELDSSAAVAVGEKVYDYYVTANGFDSSRKNGGGSTGSGSGTNDPRPVLAAMITRDQKTAIKLLDVAAIAAAANNAQALAQVQAINNRIGGRGEYIQNSDAIEVNQAGGDLLDKINTQTAAVWDWVKSKTGISGIGAIPAAVVYVLAITTVVATATLIWTWLTPNNRTSIADSEEADKLYQDVLGGYCQGGKAEDCVARIRELIQKGETDAYRDGKSNSLGDTAKWIVLAAGAMMLISGNESKKQA